MAKWLQGAAADVEKYQKDLDTTIDAIARIEAEIARSRQVFGGGRRLTRRSSRRRLANKSRRSN